MTAAGQFLLLLAMVSACYSAFAAILGARSEGRGLPRSAAAAAVTAIVSLTAIVIILARALIIKDFRFEYVTQYSDPLLPWHYSLSALWVGQAGSLLVWSWFVAVLAVLFRVTARRRGKGDITDLCVAPAGPSRQISNVPFSSLCDLAFGVQMAYLGFLLAIMVFAADPMAPALMPGATGEGLSPLLQHPAMLIHPPIVFLGYAAWGVPFALAAAALMSGRLEGAWLQLARPWALFAWTTLGSGILLGAEWAYEQLGWGGYWAWDPVENGSLMPWLTGTALVHGLMSWKQGSLKKTTLCLAIATFGLCNFATFLTRSGIFSSLHAFSKSPIGWMFLSWIAAFVIVGTILIVRRRKLLAAQRPLAALSSRDALVVLGIVALLLLTTVTFGGTLAGAISGLFSATPIVVGIEFYNDVLIPTGLVLLAVVAAVPLIRWGAGPAPGRVRLLAIAGAVGLLVTLIAIAAGVRSPTGLAVAFFAAGLVASTVLAIVAETRAGRSRDPWQNLLTALRSRRRSYGGFLVHLGFGCMAVGIAGSSLGKHETDLAMTPGETVAWEGRTVHYAELIKRDLVQKLVVEAKLEIAESGGREFTLLPAQNLYRPQNQWGSKVAIHSTFARDVYVIMHGGSDEKTIHLTLIEQPLIRWLWIGGWVGLMGVIVAVWPERQGREASERPPLAHAAIPAPHLAMFPQHVRHD